MQFVLGQALITMLSDCIVVFWLTCVNKVSLCNDPMAAVLLSVCMYVTNFNIGNISDTIYSRVMKVGQRVAYWETFKMIRPWVTLIFCQGHSIYLKFGKKPFLNIFDNLSDTINSRIMRQSPKVAWGETFKTMWHLVTLTEGYLKVRKCQFKTIFGNLSDIIYW